MFHSVGRVTHSNKKIFFKIRNLKSRPLGNLLGNITDRAVVQGQTGIITNFHMHNKYKFTVEAHVRVMLSKVTVHTHKHTAYQTLMQHPHCRLSVPLSPAVRLNCRCFSCKAFYRYKAVCLIWLLLLLLLASHGPAPLTKADREWILDCDVAPR